jgi:hypothetical protein
MEGGWTTFGYSPYELFESSLVERGSPEKSPGILLEIMPHIRGRFIVPTCLVSGGMQEHQFSECRDRSFGSWGFDERKYFVLA